MVGFGVEDLPSKTALNTPPPTTMDSDDEFMSETSSQDDDFGALQESDDGSLGDGIVHPLFHRAQFLVFLIRLTSNLYRI